MHSYVRTIRLACIYVNYIDGEFVYWAFSQTDCPCTERLHNVQGCQTGWQRCKYFHIYVIGVADLIFSTEYLG